MTKIGILGGMGPAATAHLYQKIIEIAQKKYGAVQDTDFPEIILYSIGLEGFDEAGIVDEDAVLSQLLGGIELLNNAGASFIIIPCNTVHCFFEELQNSSAVPILHIIEETVKAVKADGIECAGLLCSEITYKLHLYDQALAKQGITVVMPGDKHKVTQLILDVMKGQVSKKHKDDVLKLVSHMEVPALILGCTELPLAISEKDVPIKLYDSLSILAEAALDACMPKMMVVQNEKVS